MSGKIRTLNLVSAIIMVILLVMQFMPYWHLGDEAKDVSIQGFTWFPTDHKDLESKIAEKTRDVDFVVTHIIAMPILELLLCAAGAVCCCFMSKNPLMLLFPSAAGLFGLWGYLTQPAFRLGGTWLVHVAICVALLILGAGGLFLGMKNKARFSVGAVL